MKFSLVSMFLVVELFSSFVVTVSLKNSSTVECSDVQGCGRHSSAQLYVFGGLDGGKTLLAASQFNSSLGVWERTTAMMVGRYEFCGAAVINWFNSKIYLFGGQTAGGTTETAEIYDCETGVYSPFRSMPEPRQDCGAAVLDGYIYVAGGWDGSKKLSSVIRYNIETTRRENVSSMNVVRFGPRLVQLGGRLYAIGGETKMVEVYNPSTDRWIPVSSTNYAHNHFGATVHEGKIYIWSDLGFEVYHPHTDEWETLPPLNNHYSGTLVSMNGELWSLGGGLRSVAGGATKSVFIYYTSTRKWSEQAEMNVARRHHTAFVVYH